MLRYLVLASFAALVLAQLAPEPRYPEDVNPEERISKEASADSWPWKVFIEAQYEGTWQYVCTGVLIKRGWVLTSVACVNTKSARRVVLGEHDIYNHEGREQYISVSDIYIHPNFNIDEPYPDHDITLLRLSSDASLNNYVQLAVLPPSGQVLPNNNPCYLSGWGHPYFDEVQLTPKQIYLPIVDYKTCSSWWGIPVTTAMVCAGGSDIGCKEIFHGPLSCSVDGQWVVHGLASFVSARDCNTNGTVGAFTRISACISWINSIIG